jgi:hypothetical protein
MGENRPKSLIPVVFFVMVPARAIDGGVRSRWALRLRLGDEVGVGEDVVIRGHKISYESIPVVWQLPNLELDMVDLHFHLWALVLQGLW